MGRVKAVKEGLFWPEYTIFVVGRRSGKEPNRGLPAYLFPTGDLWPYYTASSVGGGQSTGLTEVFCQTCFLLTEEFGFASLYS